MCYSRYLYSVISLFAQRAASNLHSQLRAADAMTYSLVSVQLNEISALLVSVSCNVTAARLDSAENAPLIIFSESNVRTEQPLHEVKWEPE